MTLNFWATKTTQTCFFTKKSPPMTLFHPTIQHLNKTTIHTEHPQLYAYMANELVSPLAASDETFKLLVGEKGSKFVYVMGSQYCGLRDEGLIYIERLKENEETVHKRGRFFASTAARTIHGWINGSTSYGNGEPEPTGSDKMSMARREWDALLREWVDRVKCDILAKWDD